MNFIDNKNTQAKLLLEYLKSLQQYLPSDDIDVILKDFDNGREQGYTIELHRVDSKPVYNKDKLHVAFAESRNSDNIVVYHGKGVFNNASISDEFWATEKYFGHLGLVETANYIMSLFRDAAMTIREDRSNNEK